MVKSGRPPWKQMKSGRILIAFGVEISAFVEFILIFSGSITDSNGDTLVSGKIAMRYNEEVKNTGKISSKSRLTAFLFGIFLGIFGAHNFYLGYTWRGTAQVMLTALGILLSIVGVGLVILFGVFTFSLIESLLILLGELPDANEDAME